MSYRLPYTGTSHYTSSVYSYDEYSIRGLARGNWRRAMADVTVCTGFEPQNYLRDRCKKCFRLKNKHEEEKPPPQIPAVSSASSPVVSSPPGSSRGSYRSIEKRRSFKDKDRNEDHDADADDLVSVSSYTSATSKGLSSAKSMESIADTRSMVTAVSGSDMDRAQTPTENDPSLVISIADELSYLREENRQLKEDRERLTLRRRPMANGDDEGERGDGNLVKMLEERLNEAESCIQDYRDENTVLKCELRELQENTFTGEENKLQEKLKTTEGLCEELMEENESLKAEVKDLQTEIEEMQDQYREEEIDEFRELQRELEQHAKNSRVLQFKLRKSERAREQGEAEMNLMRQKIEDAAKPSQMNANGHVMRGDENVRIKELESELKIAKEVSVRLHGELEQTEEKRYRLEDEVFYLKEKIREMQTQNKWREARNKTEIAAKRLSAELNSSPQILPTDDMSKELRDALEREIDVREQLRFSEEDLKRVQIRLQDVENENEVLLKKLAKSKAGKLSRPPMIRSASEGNAQVQLELAEHEVEHLSTKVDRLEKTNECLTHQIAALASDSTRKVGETSVQSSGLEKKRFQLTPEMERDMSNLITTIADLEKKNRELTMQLKKGDEMRRKEEPEDPVATNSISSDLRSEQERRRGVEAELTELKGTLLKTDNQKLIALATKVEVLQNQLSLANERCTSLHRKHVRDGEVTKYQDELKERCERLERQLSEQKAGETVAELQGKVPTADEIESCCEMLASVEAQTSRICKQIERIDLTQKEERRRSLSKDSGAAIIAELANVMGEMRNVHGLLDHFKSSSGLSTILPRRSPFRELNATTPTGECANCKLKDDDAEKQKNEIIFYKKKNKDLTEQVLQTEDRWTIEIEKQRQIFENEIKTLGVKLADARRQFEETNTLLDGRTAALAEKTKSLDEQFDRNMKMQREMEEKEKKATDQETERKSAKEFEIKYKKLEGIFDAERAKMNTERARNKSELTAMKKSADEAEERMNATREELAKKEAQWRSEKANIEREVTSLKRQMQAMRRDGEGSIEESSSRRSSADLSANAANEKSGSSEVENALTIELRKQIGQVEKKNSELLRETEDLKIANVDLKSDLDKVKSQLMKDKEAFTHKSRQTDKIRTVEMDALQQKFSSRMRIMEDTNKSLHSQLVLARRARDSHKEESMQMETKLSDERRRLENAEKNLCESTSRVVSLQKKLVDLEAEFERTNTELRLTKEAKKADQILFSLEKGTKSRSSATSSADKADIAQAEAVRVQYAEYEKFYAKEVERLNQRVKDMSAEAMARQTETQKTIRELREQIRLLEIDKRNLSDTKESGMVQREMLEAEQTRLQQAVHMAELQKLTRKYRLSSIIDQLQYVSDTRRGHRLEVDHPDSIRYIINQLAALRDEDSNNGGNTDRDDRSIATNASVIRAPSECNDTYDNISQSSMSIRSTASAAPLHHSMRFPTNGTSNGNGQTRNGRHDRSNGNSIASAAPERPPPRSTSVENGNWDGSSISSRSRKISYPEPPPSFLINDVAPPSSSSSSHLTSLPSSDKGSIVGYDEQGRLVVSRGGGVVNPLSRSASFDRRAAPLAQPEEPVHFRTSSAGSNILYQVRREELARGGQPSVRLMAQAFESFDGQKPKPKRGLFGVKKSQSVDTQAQDRQSTTGSLSTNRSVVTMDEMSTATLPRGGRNPFKTMGTKIVERVRRSLSRSSRRESRERSETAPPSEMGELPRDTLKPAKVDKSSEKGSSSPKKTKKKAAESKARKLNGDK
ncbi:tag-241 [Pristionchus pacificus]|uniref:Tag-241 protein n=1 Tax=Pristionchus pacificus TaxID=54126 RepID=A0A2A6B4X0_PRIPA|nr:tag-241 [Pristionchus pacificus]|eukprot:PDM60914.1 tag-241 protein [Pristionchus pacificus]